MANQDNFKKVLYNLQYIRDLYDKMFPSAKDYIKFLRERINTLDNEEHNTSSYKNFNEIKRNIPQNYFILKKELKKVMITFLRKITGKI